MFSVSVLGLSIPVDAKTFKVKVRAEAPNEI